MKTALIFAYILIAVLAIVIFMEWNTIRKLLPASSSSSGTPGATGRSASSAADDGSAPFGDMINAVKSSVKELEIKATF